MRLKAFLFTITLVFSCKAFSQRVGIFEDHTDVGNVLHKGSSNYNEQSFRYQLSGSGSNIWFGKDEFHYLYRRIESDFILQARCKFISKGVDPHRKFGWMVRTNLDTNAAIVARARSIHFPGHRIVRELLS